MKSSDVVQAEAFRVLVIDDARAIHEDITKILAPGQTFTDTLSQLERSLLGTLPPTIQRARFRLDSAYQGYDGVRMVEQAIAAEAPYAVAFIDVQMPPGLNGIETLARIWQIDPRVQAVICTAYSDRSWEDMVALLGYTDRMLILRKPFDSIEVLQAAHALAYKWLLARGMESQISLLEAKVAERTAHLEVANAELRREIAQREKAEHDFWHLAMHDALTGLPNRILLRDRIDSAIARARRNKSSFAVLMLDLDDFKDVNDSYGHDAGDQLICEMARRISSSVRGSDSVARLGGDEFVVVLEELDEADSAVVVSQRILDACALPFSVGDHRVRTPPSIGIALFPGDGTDAETLLKSADLAMFEAKQSGRAIYRFYSDSMRVVTVKKVQLRERLERAIVNQEFTLYYQPLTDLTSGAIVGMEALIRWQDPEEGLVSPLQFIPIAETLGLIVPIGRWVLRAACEQLARWHALGMKELSMAVNVSTKQLRSADFHDDVRRALRDFGIAPGKLELEITESAAMEDVEGAQRTLGRLAEIGVRILIDDFGSGHSSLVRLKELPIHGLKIDRFFLKHVVDDPRDAAIVTAIVSMSHALGIDVVAEGIETREQLAALTTMKFHASVRPTCDRVQGYLFSKPVPAEDATILLRQWAPARRFAAR